jgi:hypothetical protein
MVRVTRGAQVATRVCGRVVRHAGDVSSRTFASGNQAFWRGVRTAAEQAELLATRRLNRMRD